MTEPDAAATVAAKYPGTPRILGVNCHESRAFDRDWLLCSVAPGVADSPEQLDALCPEWRAAVVPGTVAASLRADSGLDLERAPDFDATDWWYQCRFAHDATSTSRRDVLCFDGLATLAEVWLNGQHVLSSENMFVASEVDVTDALASENELVIRFRSLRGALDARRPRPRWRTKLVEHQQLRWQRTTLLGRMPGWSPPVRAVGPWRAVRLERRAIFEVVSGDVYATAESRGGAVDASIVLRAVGNASITHATLHVGEWQTSLASKSERGTLTLRGRLSAPDAAHWWPHTHGEQPRYDARVVIRTSDGDMEIALGRIAFRSANADRANDGFALEVNGHRIFCRGACWTTVDIVTLAGRDASYRELLTLARDAGMNMLRVGGTMTYESDAFYDLCDELGILVWQEFMFANMDYPASDPAFVSTATAEAEQVIARLRRHPSVVVFCGNSEVEQQAAMLGLDRELWSNAIFREVFPACVAAGAPGVPYCPSSPHGGALPFHADSGVAHYFGVGAYLRPLEDARRTGIRFTSECLGFSNMPEPDVMDALLPNGESPFHHPRWKARVPRDHGAGWDFEDIRDHYLAQLFGVDPMRLRYAEMDRYVALSRIVTGEVMARTIGEWRRGASTCHGAIVWFFQDIWLGAGWGVVDADARPKAAYYFLKRAMQPVAAAISDEGANGLHVHVANDRASALDAELRLSLVRGGATVTASAATRVRVAARGTTSVVADEVFGRFHDSAYAYRFGPPGHDVMIASLADEKGHVVSEVCHFPGCMPSARSDDTLISGHAVRLSDTAVEITLRADKFAQSVAIHAGDYVPEDNYFHMAPGSERTIVARARTSGARFNGFAQALNAHDGIRLSLSPTSPV